MLVVLSLVHKAEQMNWKVLTERATERKTTIVGSLKPFSLEEKINSEVNAQMNRYHTSCIFDKNEASQILE